MRPLAMRAQVRTGGPDKEKRTFEIVWITGARVLRTDWWTGKSYYEELSLDPAHVRLDRLNNGAPFLNSHNSYDLSAVLGVVEAGSVSLDGKQGVAKVLMSNRSDVVPYTQDIADGVIQNISVGYRIYKYEEFNDVETEIPIRRAIDWEPYELSAVPMGADDGAGFRSQEVKTNPCEIVTRITDQEKQTMKTPEQLAAEQAEQTRIATEQAAAASRQAAETATAAERARVEGITQAVRAARLDAAFGDQLVRDGVSLDKARAAIIDELAKKDAQVTTEQHTRIAAGEDARDKFVRGAGDWLIIRSGASETVAKAGHKVDAGEFRGLTLVELARQSLERNGISTRGMDKMTMVGHAFTRGGYNGTSDFAVLFENVMHKTLLAAYAITPDTWTRFCARGSVSDFRAHNRYLRGTFGSLDSLNEHGEFKRKQIPDGEKQTITAATKGNTIGISRQSIINDDMEALSTLPQMFGRAAKLSVEKDVYTALALNSGLGPTLSDGNPIFHDRTVVNNITTSAAISVIALDLDRVAMGGFKDISGNEVLDLRPAILLVPSSLGGQARVLNDAQYDPDTSNKLQKPNMVRGMFRDIVDTARLSGTRRYIFADPSIAPVIEVAFLDGQSEPFMETKDGWNVDGTEMKVRLDYAVGGVGYHGGVTNAGT